MNEAVGTKHWYNW